jgi:hypothetical protein
MAKRQGIYDLRYTINACFGRRRRFLNLPSERGIHAASMRPGKRALKRAEARAPRIRRRVNRKS